MNKLTKISAILALALASNSSYATLIDNDIAAGNLGHFSIDVGVGGESRDGSVTASRFATGDISTQEFIFDYFTYIDVGNGGFRLTDGTITATGDDYIQSSGSFTGSNGNIINWVVDSVIADGASVMTNTFNFMAETGTLGILNLFQYLDEDIDGSGDDVFFTRGSAADGDLRLYTADNAELYGVSHAGSYNAAQGLVNSSFSGYAACNYNSMKPAIENGTQAVSATGEICGNLAARAANHLQIGASYGPMDIVSTLAWAADANASTSTIITTIGGVPSFNSIDPDPIPEPTTMAIMFAGLASVFGFRRKQK